MRFSFASFPLLLLVGLFAGCGGPREVPTAAEIEQALRANWERAGSSSSPKATVEIHSIKIGSGASANEQDKIDGIPPEAYVTIALIDFTVRDHYTGATRAVRRVRECKVYRDQFGEWRVMTGQRRGEDVSTEEPATR